MQVKPFHWSLVTGRDFGRANRWAKTQPNLGVQIREKCLAAKKQL